MMQDTLLSRVGGDERARVQYVDIVLAFATLVSFVAVAPWVYTVIGMATDTLDPLSATLLQLSLPVFVIAMIVSIGVSARTG